LWTTQTSFCSNRVAAAWWNWIICCRYKIMMWFLWSETLMFISFVYCEKIWGKGVVKYCAKYQTGICMTWVLIVTTIMHVTLTDKAWSVHLCNPVPWTNWIQFTKHIIF
jgi:hypothetical protein